MEFKGSRTERSVLAAFAGESQARNRYSFFSSAARKEGFEQVAAVFQKTSDEEREHAKLFFIKLKGGVVEMTAAYPAGVIGDTIENLSAAAEGEKMEWSTIYPSFAKIAEEEGFVDIANLFSKVALVEANHERRFAKLLSNIEQGVVFKKDSPVKWYCRNCGYVQEESVAAPATCPVCNHPQSYFEMYGENY